MDGLGKKYNERCPGVKRLLREAIELADATEDYCARPLEDNLFEWHFTVAGPKGTEFEGGVYHGRIIMPQDYPMKPPDIVLLTPNGRFEINKKICLSISGYHPETWRPSWSIRTALLALIAFMPSAAEGTIGSLDYSSTERRALARKSQSWSCSECGTASSLLSDRAAKPPTEEERSMIDQVALKADNEQEQETAVQEKATEVLASPEISSPPNSSSSSSDLSSSPLTDTSSSPVIQAPESNNVSKEDRFVRMILIGVLSFLIIISIYRRWHLIEALLIDLS